MEMGPRLAAAYQEARNWIADSFEDAPATLTNAEVKAGIEHHYEGGWDQFIIDGAPV